MKAILINHNFTPTWLFNYPNLDYILYDRSDSDDYLKDFPKERIIKTKNIGNVDFDKLSYLIENYDTLPDVFLWGKSNLFKYVGRDYFDAVLEDPSFKPLLKFDHHTYSDSAGPVCYYDDTGMYRERNNSWFLSQVPAKHFTNWNTWAHHFGIPQPNYIPFPPGGNFFLTSEKVHKYPKELYERMRSLMSYSQLPGEAQCAERSYYLLWK